MTTEETYTAFALVDSDAGTPGITVENEDGVSVASESKDWDEEWHPDEADDALLTMGFRRIGPWEWLSPQYVAEVAVKED